MPFAWSGWALLARARCSLQPDWLQPAANLAQPDRDS